MIVTFYWDPIDLDRTISALEDNGIVVLLTTRPNAGAICEELVPRMSGTLLHLAVEGHDLDWYHYLLYCESSSVSVEESLEVVKNAAAKWVAAGQPNNFVTVV